VGGGGEVEGKKADAIVAANWGIMGERVANTTSVAESKRGSIRRKRQLSVCRRTLTVSKESLAQGGGAKALTKPVELTAEKGQ